MWEAIALTAVLGGAFGAVLAYAGKHLHINTDPRIDEINALLPGANCGACGYAGCAVLAENIVSGAAAPDACAVATAQAKEKIAAIAGTATAETKEPLLAMLACNGCSHPKHFVYAGISDCRTAAALLKTPGTCTEGCLGLGTCVQKCPFGALSINAGGICEVDASKCTGCGICTKECPQMLLHLVPRRSSLYLKCSNTSSGKKALSECRTSCIGCGVCMRVCPQGAITMDGTLPVIDYAKCNGCGICAQKCPRQALKSIVPPDCPAAPEIKRQTPSGCAACPFAKGCGLQNGN